MSSENNGISLNLGGGIGSMLTVLFVALKLLDKIDWSWWWVLSPLWIGAGLAIVLLGIVFLLAMWVD